MRFNLGEITSLCAVQNFIKKSQNFINFIKTSCNELASYDDVTSNTDDVIGAGASLSGGGELTPRRAYAKYP